MNQENTPSVYPDRDPQLLYELTRDRLATQLSSIDAIDNKIGLLVSLASGLLGILAAVFALTASSDDSSIGSLQICFLIAAAVAYGVVAVWGYRGYFSRTWTVGPDLRQVWDLLCGDDDDSTVKWDVARALWAFIDQNRPAQLAKVQALHVVFVGVVIQTAIIVLALALVAVGVA